MDPSNPAYIGRGNTGQYRIDDGPGDTVRYPWECPRCLRVNAPWLDQCMCLPGTPRLSVNFEVPKTLPPQMPPEPGPSIPRTRTVRLEQQSIQTGQYGYGPLPTASWVGSRDDDGSDWNKGY